MRGARESSSKAQLVAEPEYFSRVVHYIHLNLFPAGLTEGPSKYTFNGHRELMGKTRTPFCDVDEALLCFGGTFKKRRPGVFCIVQSSRHSPF